MFLLVVCVNKSYFVLQEDQFTYKVKVYDIAKRRKFSVRNLHNITKKFESVSSLRSALWHELGDVVPDEGDFNVGYFEGRQHTKKWLTTRQDLDAMYSYFQGKMCISLWCDGREATDEEMLERPSKKVAREKRKKDQEEELEDIFLQLKKKHGSTYSGPQLRLWARMIVAKTHDDIDNPPNVPMITGFAQSRRSENFSDALSSAASTIAKALSPPPSSSSSALPVLCSPSKTADIRMRNLEQLRALKQLCEDGVLTEEEFLSQKEIVLQALNKLV